MYESKEAEMEPTRETGAAGASPSSVQSSAVVEKRASISFSNSIVFCSARVSTHTSRAPRDWSSASSRCARVMVQYSRVIASAACHEGGKSTLKSSSNSFSLCRCHAYLSSVFSRDPASQYGWKACLYGANCQLENHASVSLRTSAPRASTTAHAQERVSSCDRAGVTSDELSRLKSSNTCARSESLVSPTLSNNSSILAMPA
mmetsp:Transcript_24664/g.57423  ORF Transcript_24664/g.57423 Transcript_24664/m.57423 type:complete len:203 (+) Transcript_24664:1151-1759(+)